jgi:hypothetical protein
LLVLLWYSTTIAISRSPAFLVKPVKLGKVPVPLPVVLVLVRMRPEATVGIDGKEGGKKASTRPASSASVAAITETDWSPTTGEAAGAASSSVAEVTEIN